MGRQQELPVSDLIKTLQDALSSLGPGAPIYLVIDNELYGLSVQVNPKGDLGPGSVILLNVPLEK